MKFTMNSMLEFEADNPDQALLKLSLYFAAQMETRPLLTLREKNGTAKGVDFFKMLFDNLDVITPYNSNGGSSIVAGDIHWAPEMLQ